MQDDEHAHTKAPVDRAFRAALLLGQIAILKAAIQIDTKKICKKVLHNVSPFDIVLTSIIELIHRS